MARLNPGLGFEKAERMIHDVKGRPAVRFRVVRSGQTPSCAQTGAIQCRGCSGWTTMKLAAMDHKDLWARYPIHCGATGLTVQVEPDSDN